MAYAAVLETVLFRGLGVRIPLSVLGLQLAKAKDLKNPSSPSSLSGSQMGNPGWSTIHLLSYENWWL